MISKCVECSELLELRRQLSIVLKELEEVKQRLLVYENAHTPPSKLRKPKYPEWESTGKSVGQQKGHVGMTREQAKPNESIKVLQKHCPFCQHNLGKPVKFERKIIEEIPEPQPVKITEYLLAHYKCKCCGKQIKARHIDCPDQGRFGLNVQTIVSLMKYNERLPHRKIAEVLKQNFNLKISPATILDINCRTSKKLYFAYENLLKNIQCSPVVHVDETGLSVSGKKYWIWIFTTEKHSLVCIRKNRGKQVIEEVLGKNYSGTIVCDGYKVYPSFTENIQRCWAHLLREVKFVAQECNEATPFLNALKKLYKKLTNKTVHKLNLKKRLHLKKNAEQTMQYWLKKPVKNKSFEKLKNKIRNGFKHWFTFLEHLNVQPTNNTAERALREHVVIRKIIGCLRNSKGIFNHQIIMSLLATWKQQGLNPYQQLKTALTAT